MTFPQATMVFGTKTKRLRGRRAQTARRLTRMVTVVTTHVTMDSLEPETS
jgi:hypothetical protein